MRGVKIKRAYEEAEPGDGYRILVDRLWPRGVKKEKLKLDIWLKELAPSPELRTWFGHSPSRWDDFQRRYRQELAAPVPQRLLRNLLEWSRQRPVTLVYAAREEQYNDAVVLKEMLDEMAAGTGETPGRAA